MPQAGQLTQTYLLADLEAGSPRSRCQRLHFSRPLLGPSWAADAPTASAPGAPLRGRGRASGSHWPLGRRTRMGLGPRLNLATSSKTPSPNAATFPGTGERELQQRHLGGHDSLHQRTYYVRSSLARAPSGGAVGLVPAGEARRLVLGVVRPLAGRSRCGVGVPARPHARGLSGEAGCVLKGHRFARTGRDGPPGTQPASPFPPGGSRRGAEGAAVLGRCGSAWEAAVALMSVARAPHAQRRLGCWLETGPERLGETGPSREGLRSVPGL